MVFKVLCGCYTQDNVVYTKGQIVKSRYHLDKLFKRKFEKIQSGLEEYVAPKVPILSSPAGGGKQGDLSTPPAFMTKTKDA